VFGSPSLLGLLAKIKVEENRLGENRNILGFWWHVAPIPPVATVAILAASCPNKSFLCPMAERINPSGYPAAPLGALDSGNSTGGSFEEEYWSSRLTRTVKITVQQQTPKTVTRGDFIRQVSETVGLSCLEALGPTARSNVWELTFNTKDAKALFLTAGDFTVQGATAVVGGVERSTFKVRVHWAPYRLPMTVITRQLEQRGLKVLSAVHDKATVKELAHVASCLRTITVETVKPADIPHILNWSFKGEGGQLLLTMTGRMPLCLKCRMTGHMRRQCDTPRCSKCHRFGHSSTTCSGPNYATRVAANVDDDNQELADEDLVAAVAASDTVVNDLVINDPVIKDSTVTVSAAFNILETATSIADYDRDFPPIADVVVSQAEDGQHINVDDTLDITTSGFGSSDVVAVPDTISTGVSQFAAVNSQVDVFSSSAAIVVDNIPSEPTCSFEFRINTPMTVAESVIVGSGSDTESVTSHPPDSPKMTVVAGGKSARRKKKASTPQVATKLTTKTISPSLSTSDFVPDRIKTKPAPVMTSSRRGNKAT
jgi:hypothetical protein